MTEYIEREALLDQLRAMESYNVSPMYRRGYDDCVATVLNAPAADVAPVAHGRWIESESFDVGFWVCSNCGFVSEAIAAHKLYNHCPNCGAKMDDEPITIAEIEEAMRKYEAVCGEENDNG